MDSVLNMDNKSITSGEILLYNNGGEKEYVNVIFRDETFWLTQKAMAELYGYSTDSIALQKITPTP